MTRRGRPSAIRCRGELSGIGEHPAALASPDGVVTNSEQFAGLNIDVTIQRAQDGDALALSDLYGRAAAWIRAGKPVPAPISVWIAGRLDDVAQAIHTRRHGDLGRSVSTAQGGTRAMESALSVALGVRRVVKKGRKKSLKVDAVGVIRAQEILYFMCAENLRPGAAMRRAIDNNKRLGIHAAIADLKTYEAAWSKHRAELLAAAGIELPEK